VSPAVILFFKRQMGANYDNPDSGRNNRAFGRDNTSNGRTNAQGSRRIVGREQPNPDPPPQAAIIIPSMPSGPGSRSDAQRDADRIRQLRDGIDDLARQGVLDLTPDQRARFDQWAAARLSELAAQYDVD